VSDGAREVRVRGLVGGLPLADDATGVPHTLALSHAALLLRPVGGGAARSFAFGAIDGVGVRGEECALFLAGGDVVELVGPAAPEAAREIATALFALPELLRAVPAPALTGGIASQRWVALVEPFLAVGRAMRTAADVRAGVQAATAAWRGAFSGLPRALDQGIDADTPVARARAARLAEALAPLAAADAVLAPAAAAVAVAPPDELARAWRPWRDALVRAATALGDVAPAVTEALDGVVAAPAARGWFRRGR
jgi:hypothetical protein